MGRHRGATILWRDSIEWVYLVPEHTTSGDGFSSLYWNQNQTVMSFLLVALAPPLSPPLSMIFTGPKVVNFSKL